jgi:hypothetical protein
MTRTRSRVRDAHEQTVYRKVAGTVVTNHVEIVQTVSVCKDDTCPYPYTANIPGQIDHFTRTSVICSGESNPDPEASSRTVITSWIPDYVAGAPVNHIAIPGIPSVSDDALKVLAFSNPNRGGKADLAQDIIEGLPGLPGRIKGAGDSVIEGGAKAHLWWSFGISPLIDDIIHLMEFQQEFNQRLREFNSLFGKGGLRRKITLGRYSAQGDAGSTVYQSLYFSLIGNRYKRTNLDRWGVVRWHPHGWSLLDIDPLTLHARIKELLLGTDFTPDSIWRKMPWTWLIDWFTTVGLWMKANKNNFPILPGPVCIMDHTVTQDSIIVTSKSDWIKVSGRVFSHETKQRNVVNPGSLSPSFFRPSTDWGLGKSSILGSLAIDRLGKGRF